MKTLKGTALFFLDAIGSGDQTPQEEMQSIIKELKSEGVKFTDTYLTESPPFRGEKSFDYLFFDWGGMSLGNSMLQHFARYLLKDAEDNPSKFYIMVSRMTADAVRDALCEMKGKEIPFNVFFTMKEFVDYANKYNL